MLQVLTGPVIEAGESLSDAIDCTGGEVVRLTMPADWTSAMLSFAVSSDGEGFNDLMHMDGTEVTFNVTAGTAVLINSDLSAALAHIKIRSGSRDNPIPQPERREFAITIKKGNATAIGEPLPAKRKTAKKKRRR